MPEGVVLAASFATRAEAEACVGRLRVAGFHPSHGAGSGSTQVFVPEAEAFAAGAFLERRARDKPRSRSGGLKLGGAAGLAAAIAAVAIGVLILVRMLQYMDGLRGR